MSDFANILDEGVTFSSTELDTGVDFTSTGEYGQIIIPGIGFGEGGFGEGGFGGNETTIIVGIPSTPWSNGSEGVVDFTPTGDYGQIIISEQIGFGEGGFGEGGFGGDKTTVIVGSPTTIWTNIETP